jgi:hypothetical protein
MLRNGKKYQPQQPRGAYMRAATLIRAREPTYEFGQPSAFETFPHGTLAAPAVRAEVELIASHLVGDPPGVALGASDAKSWTSVGDLRSQTGRAMPANRTPLYSRGSSQYAPAQRWGRGSICLQLTANIIPADRVVETKTLPHRWRRP